MIFALFATFPILAYDFSAKNEDGVVMYYNIVSSEDKTCEVTFRDENYNSYSGSVKIPASVTYSEETFSVASIGDYAFNGCSGLTEVTIPNSVTSIGDCAFYGCKGLKEVTIPNSVTEIGDNAFRFCSGLTSVTIPNSITSIGIATFSFCDELTSITIPNSVTSIGKSAFENSKKLTNVNIPNSVTSIGDYAFNGCSGLTEVTIPNSLTEIREGVFYGCKGLTEVTIPNSVTSIGDFAFCICSGLTTMYIPNSVTSIGEYAFATCSGLTSVTSANPDPSKITLGSSVFYNFPTSSCSLYVPIGSKSAYAAADQWKDFGNIEEKDLSGIEDVVADKDFDGTYTVYGLNGALKLTTTDAAEISNSLGKGIYIINGKKVLIK